jgi:hypothetical protein
VERCDKQTLQKNGVWKILCRPATIDVLLSYQNPCTDEVLGSLCSVVLLALTVTNSTVSSAHPSTKYTYLRISPVPDLKVTSFLTEVKVGIRCEVGSGTGRNRSLS